MKGWLSAYTADQESDVAVLKQRIQPTSRTSLTLMLDVIVLEQRAPVRGVIGSDVGVGGEANSSGRSVL
jgi:hypothetical protein